MPASKPSVWQRAAEGQQAILSMSGEETEKRVWHVMSNIVCKVGGVVVVGVWCCSWWRAQATRWEGKGGGGVGVVGR